jgi:hypothetical protein
VAQNATGSIDSVSRSDILEITDRKSSHADRLILLPSDVLCPSGRCRTFVQNGWADSCPFKFESRPLIVHDRQSTTPGWVKVLSVDAEGSLTVSSPEIVD